MKKLVLVLLSVILIFWGCKKEDPIYPFEQENITEEGLTFEEDSLIASLPSKVFGPSEILLDNGETVEQFLKRTDPNELPNWGHRPFGQYSVLGDDAKVNFIQSLFSKASELSSNNTFHRKEDPIIIGDDPIPFERPEQSGYGYAYNEENTLTERKRAGDCHLLIYGMDCSAFVIHMLTKAGVKFDQDYTAGDLAKEEIMNLLLDKSELQNFDYEYQDMHIAPSEIISGDIIYFKHSEDGEAFHIGVALVNPEDGNVWIYQSNGRETQKITPLIKDKGCDQYSKKDNRGPHAVPLTGPKSIFNWDNFNNYGVLRLIPKEDEDPLLIGEKENIPGVGTVWPGITWKYDDEFNSIVGTGLFVPIKGKLNEGTTFKLEAKHNFTISNPDGSASGKYYRYNNGKSILFTGGELFGKNITRASILKKDGNNLNIEFKIKFPGYTQFTTFYLKK